MTSTTFIEAVLTRRFPGCGVRVFRLPGDNQLIVQLWKKLSEFDLAMNMHDHGKVARTVLRGFEPKRTRRKLRWARKGKR